MWFTGLSGAGKTTLARQLEVMLRAMGRQVVLLDGDVLRGGLCSDLGFSAADRRENLRRAGELCKILHNSGFTVLAAFVSPTHADRAMVRTIVGKANFLEVYCSAPLDVCERRDVKGLYAQARRGEIAQFTGVSASYEEPLSPDLVAHTGRDSVAVCAAEALALLAQRATA